MESLTEQLAAQRRASRTRIPAPALAVMDRATRELAASDIGEASAAVGSRAPDFALPDATGASVALGELLGEGPVVLSFYRGGWCPYCNLELAALEGALGEIEECGARLVAVSPQLPDASLSTAEKLSLSFPVLSDVGNTVARAYGLTFRLPGELRELYASLGNDLAATNGDDRFELPVPATFVIGQDATIAWRFVDPDYTHRGDPAEILAALRSLAVSGRAGAGS